MKNKYFPLLAEPLTIKGVTFKNRIWGAPLSNPEMDSESCMRKQDIAFHENRVSGGMASTCIGLGIVDPIGRTHTKEVKLYDRMSLPSLREYANAIHRHGAVASIELAHGGRFASARSHSDHNVGVILGPIDELNPEGMKVTAMNDEQIEHAAEAFGNAAALCQEAGVDVVLVHAGHGWLIGQFMSPSYNKRTDKWGGSLENRMRFPLLVIEKIREKAPRVLIEWRMSGSELIEGGYGIEEGVEMAKAVDGLVDIIHVSAGVHEDALAFTITHPSMFQEHGVNVKYAAAIKAACPNTPVATLGGLSDPYQMEDILREGKADIIELARQSLADPKLPEKAFSGRADEIVKCCRCFTCFFNYLTNRTFCCAFNPVIGNELDAKYQAPATSSKKVVVVGGGPAGMMAALTAAQRGHDVDLYEAADALGGWLRSERYIPFKEDMHNFVNAMGVMMGRAGVKIHLNAPVTPEEVKFMNADVVFSAVGSVPICPPIPGVEKDIVVGLEAIETEVPAVGQKVVILGGGLVGMECSVYMHMLGKDVTVVEMKDDWCADAYWMHKNSIILYRKENGEYPILTNTKAKEVTDAGLIVTCADGSEKLLEADTIIMAAGLKADREQADSFYNTADRVFVIGDAVRAGRVFEATQQGYYKALEI